ncbi:MAG: hypothetical protein LQ348_007607 [Seirophora lacunosa]|nr:MAG: hypothetical protein LQ348_007607 [Seirophora lacunosa]
MADPRWKDNHRFKIDYGLPRRRQEISKRAFKDKYTTLKNLVPEGIGGLNEGIRFVRDNLDGHRYVEKQFDPTSHVLLRELLLLHVLDHPNVIRYHDGFIDKSSWHHPTASLYMDFCNLKDAQRLIDKYHRRNARKPEAHHDYIPEAFIWHIFRSLAYALQYIHFGIGVDDERNHEELDVAVRHEKYCQKVWPMIIHRDIKPGNIFFKKVPPVFGSTVTVKRGKFSRIFSRSKRKKRYFPQLPKVILGDFGLALPYNDPDWNDEQGIHGTCHWMAPELPKSYAQSDVWAVGAVILALCRQLPDGVLKPPPDDWTEGEEAWSMHPDARKGIRDRGLGEHYSVQLEFVVGECLHFSRERRPLAFKLLAMIDEGERGAREAGYLEEDMIPPFVWGGAQDTLHGRKPMPPGGKKVRFEDDI